MRKYILIVLAILLVVSIFLHSQSKKTISALTKELNKQEESIQMYQEETDIAPGPSSIAKLKESKGLNKEKLQKVLSIFDTREEELPLDISDKGIYFFQSLQASLKLLEREATSKKMILPAVDFSVDIPQEEDIPYLLKQIEMIDDIMGMVINVGKCEISAIRPNLIDNTKKILDFNKLSVQIILNIDSDSLIKVLSELNRFIPVYLIEEFSAVTIERNRLKISFVVSRILTGLSLEDVSEFRNKEILDSDSLYPQDIDFSSFSKRNPFFRDKDLIKDEVIPTATVTPAAPASKGGKSVPQFTYKGSIYMNKKLVGIIEDNWQEKTCFAESGDLCSEYKIMQIEDSRAVLSKDNQEVILLKGVK